MPLNSRVRILSRLPEESARWLADRDLPFALEDACAIASAVVERARAENCSVVVNYAPGFGEDAICTWATSSRFNYAWIVRYARAICEEMIYRWCDAWPDQLSVVSTMERTVKIVGAFLPDVRTTLPIQGTPFAPPDYDAIEANQAEYLRAAVARYGAYKVRTINKPKSYHQHPNHYTRRHPPRWLSEYASKALRFEGCQKRRRLVK